MDTDDNQTLGTTLQLCLRQSNVTLKIHAVNNLLKICKDNESVRFWVIHYLALIHLANETKNSLTDSLKQT